MMDAMIIGMGVVGCAAAYELSKYLDNVFIFDQNKKIISENQSAKNAGVFHFGGYYEQGTAPLKARLCVEGNRLAYEFAKRYGLKCKQVGKLIVATNDMEIGYLEGTLATARENEVPGVEMIGRDRVRELEPNVRAVAALYAPTSGIVDPLNLVERLAGVAQAQGAYFSTGDKVLNTTPRDGYFEVVTEKIGEFKTKILINAAGLRSDEIARVINPDSPYDIYPIRGEAAKFYSGRRPGLHTNGHNIYPAPY